jgi:hypothetical protein
MPEIAILTCVTDRNEDALRKFLRTMSTSGSPKQPAHVPGTPTAEESPFAGLRGRTHFARLVVIDMPKPHLFFSSRFDGDEKEYLAALAKAPNAWEIWKHCKQPTPVNEQTLRTYLLDGRNRVEASYVLSLFNPEVTVAQINRALELREAMARFAARSHQLDALALSHAFRQLDPVGRLAGL